MKSADFLDVKPCSLVEYPSKRRHNYTKLLYHIQEYSSL